MDQDELTALAIAKNLGFPFASFENNILKMEGDQNLERTIPKDLAREKTILPLFHDGSHMGVAMANPRDIDLIKELQRLSGFRIQPFVASKKQIAQAIDQFYA